MVTVREAVVAELLVLEPEVLRVVPVVDSAATDVTAGAVPEDSKGASGSMIVAEEPREAMGQAAGTIAEMIDVAERVLPAVAVE